MKNLSRATLLLSIIIAMASCSKKLEELETSKPVFTAKINGQSWTAKDYIKVESGYFYFNSNSAYNYNYRLQGGNLSDKRILEIYFDDLTPGDYYLREKNDNRQNIGLGWLGAFDLADQPDSKYSLYYKTTYHTNAPYVANGRLTITKNENNRISGSFQFTALRYSASSYYGVNGNDAVSITEGKFENVYLAE